MITREELIQIIKEEIGGINIDKNAAKEAIQIFYELEKSNNEEFAAYKRGDISIQGLMDFIYSEYYKAKVEELKRLRSKEQIAFTIQMLNKRGKK